MMLKKNKTGQTETDSSEKRPTSHRLDIKGRIADLKKVFTPGSGVKVEGRSEPPGIPADIPHVAPSTIEVLHDGVIQVGKVKAAIGLSWSSFNPNEKIKKQAETAAAISKVSEYNVYLDTRKTGVIGFGSREKGHQRGMRSLMTMIDDAYTGPRWLVAFRIGGVVPSYWIGAMRNGEVFEDRVVPDSQSARDIFLNMIDAPDWTRIISPPEWGVENTIECALQSIIKKNSGQHLKPVQPFLANLPAALAAVAVTGVLVFGYSFWQDIKNAEEERLAEILRMERENSRVTPQDYPWFQKAEIAEFLKVCQAEIQDNLFLVAGWGSAPIACSVSRGNGVVATTWTRGKNGRISWLQAVLPDDFPRASLDQSGDKASFSRSFVGPVDPDAMSEENWSSDMIKDTLLARFQNLEVPITLSPVVQREVANSRDNKKPIFNHHIGQVRTKLPISEIGALLSDVPGLVPESLIYTPSESTWSLIFKVYHPPILPVATQLP